jgi:hypothetical protein
MYRVDHRDKVVPLEDLPQSSIGAPCPLGLASEHRVVVAYFILDMDPEWDNERIDA